MQCNTMHAFSLYVILQCTTLIVETNDRFVQCNAKYYLFNEHGKELVLVCNAMQKVHKCYSSVHIVRSFVQSNAMLHNICYIFNERVSSGVQCNTMHAFSLYVTLQCTTLDHLCNAMQHVISLIHI